MFKTNCVRVQSNKGRILVCNSGHNVFETLGHMTCIIKLNPFEGREDSYHSNKNVFDLESKFEPIAIKLIDELYGFNESDEFNEDYAVQMRLGYPQRIIHLSNEYDSEKKIWNLENTIKVMIRFSIVNL